MGICIHGLGDSSICAFCSKSVNTKVEKEEKSDIVVLRVHGKSGNFVGLHRVNDQTEIVKLFGRLTLSAVRHIKQQGSNVKTILVSPFQLEIADKPLVVSCKKQGVSIASH